MKTVVVSSFPPRHCGIGAYAGAQVERLRGSGHAVTVVSPPDGDGDVRVPFFGGRPFLTAARLARRDDRVLVHFQPSLYYRPRAPLSKVATSMALLWLVLRHPGTEIVVHEADTPALWRPDYFLLRAAFTRATLLFHTKAEREALEREYRLEARGRLIQHAEGVSASAVDRATARRDLGIPDEEVLFLCAGFIHPDKGFDRAVSAFARAGSPGKLVIVGSVRDETPSNIAYRHQLRSLAERTPGVELIESYLSPQDFDAWIAAADRFVLPYRRSWSSGVLARAQLLGTPSIVSAVGGLSEQAGERDTVAHDDEALVRAFAEAVPAGATS